MKSVKKVDFKKLDIKRWLILGFVVIVVGASAIAIVNNLADISRLNAQAAEYSAQCEQQNKDNEQIKAILNSDSKDDYIEQKAREKGYVKSGEIVFYDISSSK